MFRQPPPGQPPAWKRPVYLFCATLLGVIVSYGLHGVIESIYLTQVEPAKIVWRTHFGLGSCALPDWLQVALLFGGLIGGYLTGRVWWRWVYVERRWSKNSPPIQT